MRRRSFYHTESTTSNQSNTFASSRPSEQLPRASSSIGLAPSSVTGQRSSTEGHPLAEAEETLTLGRSASPPVQEESIKHRRFSMLKFRHASESHLSKKAREHGFVPPVPPRMKLSSNFRYINLTCRDSSRNNYHCPNDGPQHTGDYQETIKTNYGSTIENQWRGCIDGDEERET